MALLVARVAAEMLTHGAPTPSAEPAQSGLIQFMGYVGPMAWGALGATVFLIKTLSDKVSDFAYEEKRLSGTAARIFLGAVSGLLIVKGFAPQLDALPEIAIAFSRRARHEGGLCGDRGRRGTGMAGRLSGQGNGPGPTGTVVPVAQEVLPGKGQPDARLVNVAQDQRDLAEQQAAELFRLVEGEPLDQSRTADQDAAVGQRDQGSGRAQIAGEALLHRGRIVEHGQVVADMDQAVLVQCVAVVADQQKIDGWVG